MGKDASTIKQEIEATRERMGDTVEALGYKADVGARVKDELNDRVDSVKGNVSDVVENVIDNVKNAVGGGDTSAPAGGTSSGTGAVSATVAKVADTVSNLGSSTASKVTDRVANISDATSAKLHDSVANLSGATSKVTDRMANLSDGVTSKLQSVDVRGGTQRAVGVATENPIGLALVALALGYLTGSLLPVSDVERERLGPIRDKVVDQAQAATHDLIEAGKAVVAETAQNAVSTALFSAQTHGHDVVEAAKGRVESK